MATGKSQSLSNRHTHPKAGPWPAPDQRSLPRPPPCRNTRHGHAGRNRRQNHRSSSHAGMMPHLDIAEDLGTGTQKRPAPDLGMAVATFLARSPQCDIMQHGDIITDLGSRTDNKAGGVIKEDAFAKGGSG